MGSHIDGSSGQDFGSPGGVMVHSCPVYGAWTAHHCPTSAASSSGAMSSERPPSRLTARRPPASSWSPTTPRRGMRRSEASRTMAETVLRPSPTGQATVEMFKQDSEEALERARDRPVDQCRYVVRTVGIDV